MNSYVAYELYRERLAQYEREAEVRRHLPKRQRRWLARFGLSLPRFRKRAPVVVARAVAEARPCH